MLTKRFALGWVFTVCSLSFGTAFADYSIEKVRLVDGEFAWQGRLEVFYGGEWGTVCDDGWDNRDARVACRMLHYSTENARAFQKARFGVGGLPILLDDVGCSGFEQSLNDCPHSAKGQHNCGHNEDAGVDCFPPDFQFTTAGVATADPETLVVRWTVVTCDVNSVQVQLNTDYLRAHGIPDANTFGRITLGEGDCSGYRNGSLLLLEGNITECIPHIHETSSTVFYRGNLRIYRGSNSLITRDPVIEVELECVLPRELTVGGEYVVNEPYNRNAIIQASGSFNTSMEFYRDLYFHNQITSFPHQVGLGESLFVQISINSKDSDLRLVVQSCQANPDPQGSKRYWLIKEKCPVDSTTTVLPSGEDFARFEFTSFEFIGSKPEVFLNCQVTVCEPHDIAAHCQPGRCPRSSASSPAKRSRDIPSIHLSLGPLILPAHSAHNSHEEPGLMLDVEEAPVNGERSSLAVGGLIAGGAVLCLGLVGIALFLRRKYRGPVYM